MKRRLSIAIVSRSNALGGGASRVAEELADWLFETGSHVLHFCAFPVGALRAFQAPLFQGGVIGDFAIALHRFTARVGLKEFVPLEFYTTLWPTLNSFDVIHFHDLNTAISPLTLHLCSRKKAVIFTAHDCSCFTGGCIYPLGCERYQKKCGRCPQLSSLRFQVDFTQTKLVINRRLAEERNIHFIFPSQWLFETSLKSLMFANSPKIIPYGFSSKKYGFQTRHDARRELGIRDAQRVIIVAAHYLADPRKGAIFSFAAIRSVNDLAPLVIFVGIPPEDVGIQLPDVRFWLAGFVRDRHRVGLLFAAANVFLFCSLEDNLPIMVQESLAAGTPVVGFASGGVPEMVDHQHTGLLCKTGDQQALNENLRVALTSSDLDKFGEAAIETVRDRFDVNTFGQMHLDLYARAAR